jgi:RNA polymerase sigma-70 factor (ECF subfamily)
MRKPTNDLYLEEQKEEVEMLLAIAKGDKDAFSRLHERFSGVVHSTIYKVLNDVMDTEDVAQEVFAAVWRKAELYSEKKGKPLTWVTTMARNRAIDRLRYKQRQSRLNDDFKVESGTFAAPTRVDTPESADSNDRHRIVRSAVMELSNEQRDAIQMAFFSGLTQSEIADKLGEPLGTVKARIRRGMLRLRSVVPKRL